MPANPLDEPVKKVTFNMYLSDYRAFIQAYGDGWSSKLREVIRVHVKTNMMFERGAQNG